MMPSHDLSSRRALVTGGASGIGFAVAESLVQAGAKVAIGDVNKAELQSAAASINSPNLLAIPLDVTSADSVRNAVRACVDKLGGLDTVVNSAGIIDFAPLEEIRHEDWDRVIDIDLKGVFFTCQEAVPYLRQSGRGRIINISSDAGKIGVGLISSYCAAKSGVIGFSKAIAAELAPYGTTVNCVCPGGVTATQMGQKVLDWISAKSGKPKEEILADREKSVPLGRMQTTEDVSGAVIFLISDAASYITGEAINVDGGGLGTARIRGL